MWGKIINRLFSVKSIITLVLTGVFAVLTVRGALDQNFMMIYTVIVSFYFGTQVQKQQTEPEQGSPVSVDELTETVKKEVLAELQEGENE